MEREIRITDLPYQSRGIAASFLVENKMAAFRRLALFNALLDLVRDTKRLVSENICSVEGNSAAIFFSKASPGIFGI